MNTDTLQIYTLKENSELPQILSAANKELEIEAGFEIPQILKLNEKDFVFWNETIYPLSVPIEKVIQFFIFKGVPLVNQPLPKHALIKVKSRKFYVSGQLVAEF